MRKTPYDVVPRTIQGFSLSPDIAEALLSSSPLRLVKATKKIKERMFAAAVPMLDRP